jgi:hypothetical protein
MRTLMKVQFPTEAGNRGIKDGTLPDIIRKTLETVQAEAAYFTAMDGKRTMLAVFDLKAASDIPRIAEPLFMGLNASVEFIRKRCCQAATLSAGGT